MLYTLPKVPKYFYLQDEIPPIGDIVRGLNARPNRHVFKDDFSLKIKNLKEGVIAGQKIEKHQAAKKY
ncbi:MAG: hypothetical protein HQK55_13565 [Deltaproteobacteria bacterium]|nr:hypothetical protein [Deltaproteobacteria bacterium]